MGVRWLDADLGGDESFRGLGFSSLELEVERELEDSLGGGRGWGDVNLELVEDLGGASG